MTTCVVHSLFTGRNSKGRGHELSGQASSLFIFRKSRINIFAQSETVFPERWALLQYHPVELSFVARPHGLQACTTTAITSTACSCYLYLPMTITTSTSTTRGATTSPVAGNTRDNLSTSPSRDAMVLVRVLINTKTRRTTSTSTSAAAKRGDDDDYHHFSGY